MVTLLFERVETWWIVEWLVVVALVVASLVVDEEEQTSLPQGTGMTLPVLDILFKADLEAV